MTASGGPLLVVAGPGSGKTRVLTTRIAYLIANQDVAPWNILALTFTNKAAREMQQRVEEQVGRSARWITVGTFHSFAARILRQYGGDIGVDPRFVIYDDTDQLGIVRSALGELNLDSKQFTPRSILGTISQAKSHNIDSQSFAELVGSYWEEIVARVYPVYQETLSRRNALDFDDLLALSVKLLRESGHARFALVNRYQQILVDEYQDTNHTQYLIVSSLVGEQRNICVVGDPDQSIYGWRAADIRNILNFKHDFPDATEIHLEENYRSTPEILKAADSVIRENRQRIDRTLRTSIDSGELIVLRDNLDEFSEARFVVNELSALEDFGYNGSDIAILYRTNVQSRPIEEALIRAGIPYQLIGGTRFYDRREVRDVLALLRLISNPNDFSAFERVIDAMPIGTGIGAKTLDALESWARSHNTGLAEALQALELPNGPNIASRGKSLLANVRNILTELQAMSGSANLLYLFDQALDLTGYSSLFEIDSPELIERWENVLQLRTTVDEWNRLRTKTDELQDSSLSRFLEEVALVSDADTIENAPDRVTLITLHAVKGLEFKVVFITGVEEGLIPHRRSISEDPSMLEEERRLFYVGITRAQERLYFTYAMRRSRFGYSEMTVPSSFLASIPSDIIGQPTATRRFRLSRSSRLGTSTVHTSEPIGEPALRQLSVGERVFHASFGDGVVTSVIDRTDDQEVTVEFVRHGEKRLMASLANLIID